MRETQITIFNRKGRKALSCLVSRVVLFAHSPLFSALMFVTIVLGLASPMPALGDTIFALTTSNRLLRFDSNTPSVILDTIPITGLQSGESILGIDFRPTTGQLYALSGTNRLYIIDLTSGAATQIGSDGAFVLDGNVFGFDFNPVPDRIRVVSNNEQNLRLNPNDGTLAGTDAGLAYASGDINETVDPNIVAAAYTNNSGDATTTTLYVIDFGLDILARQGGVNVPPGTPSPNDGQLFTVGSLGVAAFRLVGFDIASSNGIAFAAFRSPGNSTSQLYTINLLTGKATLVGSIGVNRRIVGLSVSPTD
ncbi:MAG: DUF4394 domain-containing protein [Thermodesulfobacteriota bacterium]